MAATEVAMITEAIASNLARGRMAIRAARKWRKTRYDRTLIAKRAEGKLSENVDNLLDTLADLVGHEQAHAIYRDEHCKVWNT